MKQLLCIILCFGVIASLAACGAQPAAGVNNADVAAPATETANDVDLDLTVMSSTMVFSEVQNMMLDPQSYMGKTVRMSGAFNVAEYEENRYFACLIADATACCAQGIEFDWEGDHSYPQDYPEQGDEITVTGTFTTYMEGQQTFCQLEHADVQF